MVIYKKTFLPSIITEQSFFCCYRYKSETTPDTNAKIYEKAINWINKYQKNIKVVKIETSIYDLNYIKMQDGIVTVHYELVNNSMKL